MSGTGARGDDTDDGPVCDWLGDEARSQERRRSRRHSDVARRHRPGGLAGASQRHSGHHVIPSPGHAADAPGPDRSGGDSDPQPQAVRREGGVCGERERHAQRARRRSGGRRGELVARFGEPQRDDRIAREVGGGSTVGGNDLQLRAEVLVQDDAERFGSGNPLFRQAFRQRREAGNVGDQHRCVQVPANGNQGSGRAAARAGQHRRDEAL
jgi:hypothetical protein